MQAIGFDRVVLGSDWPVLGDQQAVQLNLLKALKLSAQNSEKLSILNAERIYNLGAKRAAKALGVS